jgi:hypothetical protein
MNQPAPSFTAHESAPQALADKRAALCHDPRNGPKRPQEIQIGNRTPLPRTAPTLFPVGSRIDVKAEGGLVTPP